MMYRELYRERCSAFGQLRDAADIFFDNVGNAGLNDLFETEAGRKYLDAYDRAKTADITSPDHPSLLQELESAIEGLK